MLKSNLVTKSALSLSYSLKNMISFSITIERALSTSNGRMSLSETGKEGL
jgi:hypothetical protein